MARASTRVRFIAVCKTPSKSIPEISAWVSAQARVALIGGPAAPSSARGAPLLERAPPAFVPLRSIFKASGFLLLKEMEGRKENARARGLVGYVGL